MHCKIFATGAEGYVIRPRNTVCVTALHYLESQGSAVEYVEEWQM